MSYSNVEILSGVLVVACLMLFWCQRSKNVDGMKHGQVTSGLQFRDGYSGRPLAGRFTKEGYVVGHPGDRSLSYTARSSYMADNMEDKGLNDLTTTATPASDDVSAPSGESSGLWLAEADVNNYKLSTDDEQDMYNNIFSRQISKVTAAGETVSGSQLHYIDYGANMVATRQVTM